MMQVFSLHCHFVHTLNEFSTSIENFLSPLRSRIMEDIGEIDYFESALIGHKLSITSTGTSTSNP